MKPLLALALLSALASCHAHGEDYWTDCEQAYRFCEQQGYHRDCTTWTERGRPLSVNRYYYPPVKPNPNIDTPLCKENPRHIRCGNPSEEILSLIHEYTECPIPEKYHPVNGMMPWAKCECKDLPPTYQGSGSSRSSTPAPCTCQPKSVPLPKPRPQGSK